MKRPWGGSLNGDDVKQEENRLSELERCKIAILYRYHLYLADGTDFEDVPVNDRNIMKDGDNNKHNHLSLIPKMLQVHNVKGLN